MKIKKLLIVFSVLVAATMTACSEYEDTVEPSPIVAGDNPAVRFAQENQTFFELDPSDLSIALTVIRDNESSAVEVPVSVVGDTLNAFNVPATLSFAAGEKTTTLNITVDSSAPTGVNIPLELKFDDNYINPYKTEYSTYHGTVSVIKWNSLGTVQFYDSFSFYQVVEVTLEQRDDQPSVYRINSPYQEPILLDAEWEGWIGGATQDKIIFTVDGNNVVWDDFWYTNLLYEGVAGQEIKAYLPSAIDKEGDEESVVVKGEDGAIQYFLLNPSFYIDGLGGFGLSPVYIGYPGFDLAGALELPLFEAN